MLLPSMDPAEKVTLQNCRNCLLEDLDPSISFLSLLSHEGILTEDQRERVEKQTTRQDKIIVLLDTLPRRGPRAFHLFVSVLNNDYKWLAEKLQSELRLQQYTQKIKEAFEERMRQSGEFIRDKDYINKIITETVMPVMMAELNKLAPVGGNSGGSQGLEAELLGIINDHVVPLVRKSHSGEKGKLKMTSLEGLLNKLVDLMEELERKCTKALTSEDQGQENAVVCRLPLPDLIHKKLADVQTEVTTLRKEVKKNKKSEDKLLAEHVKVKADLKVSKDEVRRLKEELKQHKAEAKKHKDQIQKLNVEKDKLKKENQDLKDHLESMGVDLRISSDFM